MHFAGREVGEGIEALRRAVRYILVAVGATAVAMAGSAPVGMAAVPGPISEPSVTAISPGKGDVVGIAATIEVTFAAPVTNRARAERSIDIASNKTPAGSFSWLSNQTVQWAPDQFWPAHSPISVTAGGFSTSFETGSAGEGGGGTREATVTFTNDEQPVGRKA